MFVSAVHYATLLRSYVHVVYALRVQIRPVQHLAVYCQAEGIVCVPANNRVLKAYKVFPTSSQNSMKSLALLLFF